MANDAMDNDSDDLASLAKLETLDGTTVLTGSMKKTTYVPRNIVPNTTLGSRTKLVGLKALNPLSISSSWDCTSTARTRTSSTIRAPKY